MEFNYGFEIDGKTYAWKEKKFFRLPYNKNKRHFGLRRCKEVLNNGILSYFINGKPKSIKQIKKITKKFCKPIVIKENYDIPN